MGSRDLDRPTDVDERLARAGPARRDVAGMLAMARERARLVPEGGPSRDPRPHLPIGGVHERGMEAAQLFVERAADHDGRREDPAGDRDPGQPFGDDAWAATL